MASGLIARDNMRILFARSWPAPAPTVKRNVFQYLRIPFARSQPKSTPSQTVDPLSRDDSTGSDTNFELAKMWIRDCTENHDECGDGSVPKSNSQLPTRVIHVGELGNLHILETSNKDGKYLALSYCWGNVTKLLNTKTRYVEFQTQLPKGEMPATFRDACEVAHRLGYLYLWIDALCIIQDDTADVQREMSNMGSIYQNADFTIFAANGPDTDSGLFLERDGRLNKPCDATITVNESEKREQKEVAFTYPRTVHENPLSQRGKVS